MNSIISVENLSKSFGAHTALNNISLEIPAQSIFGLLGPNGAGKTTLLRVINQITFPDSGSVLFDGEPLKKEHIAQIGYLPEERGLYKSMKVGEQALYLAQLKGLSASEARKQLKYWFERLEIGDWWNKKIQELSKGMAQKIQFIVTVLHKPKLLIFDEPFSGFDPINASLIKDQILFLKEQGASIIFSTHRMESVEELCEYIALIHRAEMILEGRLSAIKNSYKKNIFQVSLAAEKALADLGFLQENFTLSEIQYDPEESQWNFTVQLPDTETGPLLNLLSTRGRVMHFRELIPTANEIFIQTVQQKDTHE